jgi:hypothetical protein
VRVSSDNQTLILAGESSPPSAGAGRQLQRVRVLFVEGEYADVSVAVGSRPDTVISPVVRTQSHISRFSPDRARSTGAAEYARTQDLTGENPKIQIIDTYA